MLRSILVQLRRLLRLRHDENKRDVSRYLSSFEMFETASDCESPCVRVCHFISRFCKSNIYGGPRRAFLAIKWFIQRGRRGWADCDTWSLDWYLDRWMPDALRYLKANKCGIPRETLEGLPTNDENGFCPTDEAFSIAEERWNSILDRMIAGFEAGRRMSGGLYNSELGPDLPWRRPAGVSADAWQKISTDRTVAISKLKKRDQELFNEGMALFVEYYRSLWD